MKTTTPKSPTPTAELVIRSDGDAPAAVLLGRTDQLDGYLITPVAEEPSAARGLFGCTYRVEKIADGTVYLVTIGTRDGQRSSCQCKGWVYRRRCKHTTGLAALIAAGKL